MSLTGLTKKKAARIIGIDASTKSFAFAIFDNDVPVSCGEIFFKGDTVFKRMKDAQKKVRKLVKNGTLKADYVTIESAIMVKNPNVAIDLAYVYGVIIAELMETNPEVHKVAPISWQTGIGNPNLKADEKNAIKIANPDRKPSWYQNEGRKLRKARTLAIANEYFTIQSNSDNVGDAVGLALFTSRRLTKR